MLPVIKAPPGIEIATHARSTYDNAGCLRGIELRVLASNRDTGTTYAGLRTMWA